MPSLSASARPWHLESLRTIDKAGSAISKSFDTIKEHKAKDHLPHLRTLLAELSNAQALKYFREVRCVVSELRVTAVEVNEEILSLSRVRDALEKQVEVIRKHTSTNRACQNVRQTRPQRELRDDDEAGRMLRSEAAYMASLRQELEKQLHVVVDELRELDQDRKRLNDVIRERSNVMELVCNAFSIATSPRPLNETPCAHSHAASALRGKASDDPLSALTPEAKTASENALASIHKSRELRNEAMELIRKAREQRWNVASSVNTALASKLDETAVLRNQLVQASGESRTAINKNQRWLHVTDVALHTLLGPEKYSDLATAERFDRPMVKVYQRHPGNQLPEARYLTSATNQLQRSKSFTQQNIGELSRLKHQLDDDSRDKNKAFQIDQTVLRIRRQKIIS